MAKKREIVSDSVRCTADNPMPDGLSDKERSRWTHPDMVMVYEGSLYDEFECPNCGLNQKAAKR